MTGIQAGVGKVEGDYSVENRVWEGAARRSLELLKMYDIQVLHLDYFNHKI